MSSASLESGGVCEADVRDEAQLQEVAPEALDGEALIREARERLRGRLERDATTGRFAAGNGAAAVTRERSVTFWQEVNDAKQAIIARALADVGGSDEAGEIKSGVVEQYAEAKILRRSLFLDIAAAGGTATAKRHARRLLAPYGQAFDRELKAAQVLGLERRVRDLRTMPIDDYLEAERQQQQPRSPTEQAQP